MNFTLEIWAYRHYHEWLTETDVNAETIFGVKSRWTTLNIHTRNALYTNLPLTSDRQRDLLPAPHQHPRDHGQRRLHHRPRLRHPADEQDARPVRRRLLQPRLQGLQRARRQEAGGLHHP